MWEAVWLYALVCSGISIEHEKPLADGCRPDFRFVMQGASATTVVVGDITSVSDKGLHSSNPVRLFWDAVLILARKHKLDPSHFSYSIDHRMDGPYGNRKAVLLLPARKEIRAYLKREIEPYIRYIAETKPAKDTRSFHSNDVQLALQYNTSQEFSGGGHIVYNIPYSATRNPIHTALEKKARQLSDAPESSIRVVILCDADCYALQTSTVGSGAMSAAQVVQHFLRKSGSIDAVLIVTTELIDRYSNYDRRLRISAKWITRTSGARFVDAEGLASVRAILASALDQLPTPMLDPHNAMIRASAVGYGHGTLGAAMSDKRIKISARKVLELLAGTESQERFLRSYGWDGTWNNSPNPFQLALARGKVITSTSITPGGDADDDWIEFEFSDPDPAISPFRRSGEITE